MKDINIQLSDILNQVIGSVSTFKPELVIILTFLVSIISTLFIDKRLKLATFFISIIGVIVSILCLLPQFGNPTSSFFGMLIIDDFAVFARAIIAIGLLISFVLIQQHYHNKPKAKKIGDLYSILLSAGLGLNLLTITTNWLLTFIAIELLSISSYVLVGYFSETKKQSEAAMKYALFGSVSAAVMLYGLSLIYGFTGNLDFTNQTHIQGLIEAPKILTTVTIVFIFAGIGFKLSFVPFHLWSPDVYEGAPTPITAFLSTVPKIAVIVLLSRLFQAWQPNAFYFSELILIIVSLAAIITMLVGNLIALRQSNAKRMMAYSSIGHTGFLLMAIIPNNNQDPQIILYYLAVYTIMNLAVFAFIDYIEQHIQSSELKDFAGLGRKLPLLFTGFTIVGVSLIGLPPTAGFIGKLLVFSSIFEIYQSNQNILLLLLLVVGALTSVISLFFYFKIPLFAFLRKEEQDFTLHGKVNIILAIAVVLSISTIVLGLFPNLLLTLFK